MKKQLVASACLVIIASASSASGATVYDNLATPVNVGGSNQSYSSINEFGDQIVLAGTSRDVTDFKFSYFLKVNSGVSTGLEIARIRFYKNDGVPAGSSFAPSTLLWDSRDFSVPVSDAMVWDRTVPNITVPDSFTWSVLFGNILPTESAGLLLFDPPTIGSNFNSFWENAGGTWQLRTNANPSIPMNFGAQVSAVGVPEPTALALVAVGIALFGIGIRNR